MSFYMYLLQHKLWYLAFCLVLYILLFGTFECSAAKYTNIETYIMFAMHENKKGRIQFYTIFSLKNSMGD